MKKKWKVIGLMSGTSADGINAAIVEIDCSGKSKKIKILYSKEYPFTKEIRRQINDISSPGHGTNDLICHLNFLLGERFGKAAVKVAKEAGIPLKEIDLIGSHGQTISHIPREIKGKKGKDERYGYRMPSTLQLGEGAVIADLTGVTTVSDFRTSDIAAGGEGAPLTPFAHKTLFGSIGKSVTINNIGGISNVTFLPKSGKVDDIIAFDTGPGNVLMDTMMFLLTEGKKNFDTNGAMARKGKADELFIRRMMHNPYLRKEPPKSTGREDFGIEYAKTILNQARIKYIAPDDLMATVTAYTARTISLAYRKFISEHHTIDEAIFCGGGVKNKTLMSMITETLAPLPIKITSDYGIPCDAVESAAFAILAQCTIKGEPANITAATGAKRNVVLGKINTGNNGF